MRVAIFIDGKNFHAGWRAEAGGRQLDFGRLASRIVERVGGDQLWGVHYYTGVERGEGAIGLPDDSQAKLVAFLNMLELQPGYFVNRFSRKAQRVPCPHCGEEIRFTKEKEVDTTMVADMLRLAAVDGFDVLVLVSGDADHAPAVEGVRALGKKVFVASWGYASLAARMRQAAFDHLNLTDGALEFVAPPAIAPSPVEPGAASVPVAAAPAGSLAARVAPPALSVEDGDSVAEAAFLHELGRAGQKFAAGYVGLNFFLTRWRSELLDESVPVRQRLLDRLVGSDTVEIYDAPDGNKALRLRSS